MSKLDIQMSRLDTRMSRLDDVRSNNAITVFFFSIDNLGFDYLHLPLAFLKIMITPSLYESKTISLKSRKRRRMMMKVVMKILAKVLMVVMKVVD